MSSEVLSIKNFILNVTLVLFAIKFPSFHFAHHGDGLGNKKALNPRGARCGLWHV